MRKLGPVLATSVLLSMPVYADSNASANAEVSAEANADTGFFSRTWNAIGGLFGAGADVEASAKADAEAQAKARAEAKAEAEAKAKADAQARQEAADKKAAEARAEAAARRDRVKASGEATVEAGKSTLDALKGAVSTDTSVNVKAGASVN